MTRYASGQLSKGDFVAVMTADPEENFGLPFWIGKVVKVVRASPDEDEDGVDSADEDDEDEEAGFAAIIHEYEQKRISTGKKLPEGSVFFGSEMYKRLFGPTTTGKR